MIEMEEQKITNPTDWSFSSSFLYSLSLITTMGKIRLFRQMDSFGYMDLKVGYGDKIAHDVLKTLNVSGYNGKSPKSSMGKIVAMGITIVGIPLLMIYLAVVGAGLARTFLRLYCKLCCCPWLCNAR